MIYIVWLFALSAPVGKAIGTVLSAAITVILIVGGIGLLLLIIAVFAIGGLLGGRED